MFVESRRNGSARTFRFGAEGGGEVSALLLRGLRRHGGSWAGAWSWGGDESPIYENWQANWPAWAWRRYATSFPTWSTTRAQTRPRCWTDTVVLRSSGCRRRPDLPCWREAVHGRANDFPGPAQRPLDAYEPGVLRFSVQPAKPAGNETRDHLRRLQSDAVPAGNAGHVADLQLLRPACTKLGSLTTLHVIETADHSFHLLKRSSSDRSGCGVGRRRSHPGPRN